MIKNATRAIDFFSFIPPPETYEIQIETITRLSR